LIDQNAQGSLLLGSVFIAELTAQYITGPRQNGNGRARIELARGKVYAGAQRRQVMNEEPTKNLPSQSFEERILAEFAAVRAELAAIRGDINRIDSRLTKLEERFDRLEAKVDRLDEKVDRLDARVDHLDGKVDRLGERFEQLDEKVDRRLQETRPIWEAVQAQMGKLDRKEAVQAQMGKLDRKFDLVIKDLYEVRQDHVVLAQRVDQLDRARTTE
jgi:chromosome segregation ATPase